MKKMIFFIIIISLLPLVSSAPPELHPIEGFVFFESSQASNGFSVRINSLTTNDEVNTITFGPPGNTGYYSTNTLLSVVGELIQILSYNSTNYGINTNILNNLTEGTTKINVTINQTRPSELFLERINFSDNSYLSLNNEYNLIINVTNVGYSVGSNCNINISFSNQGIIIAAENYTSYSNINVAEEKIITFNLTAQNIGNTNMLINGTCDSDSINIEKQNFEIIYDVEVIPNTPSFHPIEGFVFNSDGSMAGSGISVTINSVISGDSIITQTSGPPGFSGYFSVNNLLAVDNEIITITAINGSSYGVNNGTVVSLVDGVTKINVTMNKTVYFGIIINDVVFDDSINNPSNELVLNPGTTSKIWCNASVENSESYTKITEVSAKIYDNKYGDTGILNNNSYYSNSSCSLVSGIGNFANYSCVFEVKHFANNGTWVCEVFAKNDQNDNNTFVENSTLLPLYSFSLSNSIIDYGNLPPGTDSSEENINITNTGNMNFSVYLWTYGGDNASSGFNNSFNCIGNNISYNYHKYSWASGITYNSKTSLYNSITDTGVDLFKKTIDNINSTNTTYWQINIPSLNPPINLGECNGTIVFEAFN